MSKKLKAGEYFGKISNTRRLESSTLLEVIHRQGVNLPQHSHEQAFFSFLLSGSYAEKYGQKSFTYRPMTVWWHRPGIVHKDEVGRAGGHFFNLEIRPQSLAKLGEIAEIPEDFYVQNDSLVWLVCRLYHEFKNWESGSELIAEGITLEMLGRSAQKRLLTDKRPPKWLLRVIEKLSEEFTESFSLEKLAHEIGVHPVHLSAVFRRFQGQTIGEFVQKQKLSKAVQMLSDNEMPLAEIAVSVGFYDQSHLTGIFKKYLGMPPGAFRKSLKNR